MMRWSPVPPPLRMSPPRSEHDFVVPLLQSPLENPAVFIEDALRRTSYVIGVNAGTLHVASKPGPRLVAPAHAGCDPCPGARQPATCVNRDRDQSAVTENTELPGSAAAL